MRKCDKCSGSIPDEARFCPQCGDPVTEADVVVMDVSAHEEAEVEISFGWSSSGSYAKAVAICERVPSYECSGEGKDIQHSIKLPITEVELLVNLYELVGSWKSSTMLVNGLQESKSALTQKGMGCYRKRLKAYDKQRYCFGEQPYELNIWGCKRLGLPLYSWGGGWLEYGHLDTQGVWHFDKARLQHELQSATSDFGLCPALDRQQVLETLSRLPDTINPRNDPAWAYVTRHEEVRGKWQEVATGIKPVLPRADRYIVGTYKPSWDEPQDDSSSEIRVTIESSTRPNRRTAQKTSGCLIPALTLCGSLLALAWFALSSLGGTSV